MMMSLLANKVRPTVVRGGAAAVNDFGFGLIVGTYTGAIVAGMEMHGFSWLYQAFVLFGLWFVGLMFVSNEEEVDS